MGQLLVAGISLIAVGILVGIGLNIGNAITKMLFKMFVRA